MGALEELQYALETVVSGHAFQREWRALLASYVGRPTPLSRAERLARAIDPTGRILSTIWLKREDLCHTGAHKINNALGQVLLARRMGKTRIIAETGAGQHGVATASACALLGLPCEIYMGIEDVKRQSPNVGRMRLLGAKVVPVESGSRTLKDAMNEALRDWVTNVRTTYYCIGSAAGPHPYPELVARLQSVIGEEARAQVLTEHGGLPDAVVACVGGGSNAIGLFRAFMTDRDVTLVGVEAAGLGVSTGHHAATLTAGRVGVLHGSKSYVLCDEVAARSWRAHSISAGLGLSRGRPRAPRGSRRRGARLTFSATDDEALAMTHLVAPAPKGSFPAHSRPPTRSRAWATSRAELQASEVGPPSSCLGSRGAGTRT